MSKRILYTFLLVFFVSINFAFSQSVQKVHKQMEAIENSILSANTDNQAISLINNFKNTSIQNTQARIQSRNDKWDYLRKNYQNYNALILQIQKIRREKARKNKNNIKKVG